MLKFVTKKEYWYVIDSGIMKGIPSTKLWHLKDIQDEIAYSNLYSLKDKCIAEIGAGNSRLLSTLSQDNKCYAIDEYKGQGNGPINPSDIDGVTTLNVMLGKQSPLISNNFLMLFFL